MANGLVQLVPFRLVDLIDFTTRRVSEGSTGSLQGHAIPRSRFGLGLNQLVPFGLSLAVGQTDSPRIFLSPNRGSTSFKFTIVNLTFSMTTSFVVTRESLKQCN